MLAIDLTRAFDTIYRPLLWLKMFIAKVNPIIIMSLIEYYGALFAYIELDGELSKVIKLITGVKQGGPASPTLFNFNGDGLIICIEALGFGISIGTERIDTVLYADDDFIMSQKEEHLHKQIIAIESYAGANGLEVNVKKN